MFRKILKKVFYKLIIVHIYDFFNFYIRIHKPSMFHNYLKSKFLKLMGADVGKNLVVYPGVWIDNPKYLRLGHNVDLSKDVTITTSGRVCLGSNVLIGYGSKILSTNHKIPETREIPIRFAGHEMKPVVIEDDVWVCANCVILPGVTIGKGAVIAAGAVVTKNVPSFCIYGGVPAKLIKERKFTLDI